ncbi:MurR/RpiR family transcriptional regulator [Lactobacillus johnsonii]|jgi:DNA-binding MurR/RpiR family transcriptional regulator|uniref:MurR/RpiR family transcriptional regulator n=1 Tax=Lactobacillus johnsonii TaxID=33959 RepID=UPI001FB43BA8|nr:MurR/RpiR family transcriptional regulator [Lactobacillus johnsonii]MDO5007529.1 MurR/RpiR family transcriptional regulator [Lactobacillus johnsonii]UOC06239.1 MurR/RpiR family transcriptional regulator [Lactobacillus johnsonii]
MADILNIIHSKKAQMPKKEQFLAEYISNNIKTVIKSSIQKLSKDTGISTATIVRFCQEIGVDGFSELKLELAALQLPKEPAEYDEIDIGEDVSSIKDKMATRFKSVIDITKSGIDEKTISKLVKEINQASRILAYGVGASGLVANDLYQKFLRLGKAITYTTDFHIAATQIGNFSPDDILILISNQGMTTEISDLLEVGKSVGIKTVLLTAQPRTAIAKKADLVLLTQDIGEPKIRSGATTSMISQLFVVDVLVFAYISRYSDKVFENLKRSNKTTLIHKNKKRGK